MIVKKMVLQTERSSFMRIKKQKLALLMAGILLMTSPVSVMADREDAKLEKPYVSL